MEKKKKIKTNEGDLSEILEGNSATIAGIFSVKELSEKKANLLAEWQEHYKASHRENLADKCGTCDSFRTDMKILTRAIEIRSGN